MMRQQSVVAIGWAQLGDLSTRIGDDSLKASLKTELSSMDLAKPQTAIGRAAQQVTHFCQTIKERDYVVASDGAAVLGIGRIVGPYTFDASTGFPHQRPVEWLSLGEWHLPTTDGLRTTVYDLRRHEENLVAIESRVIDLPVIDTPPHPPLRPVLIDPRRAVSSDQPVRPERWTSGGMVGRIQDVLARKGQVILYGPPGTGKTHWAEAATKQLASLWNCGKRFEDLSESESATVFGGAKTSFVCFCCFHPAYGYEDFIEGYRPIAADQALRFELKDGVFKGLCSVAAANPTRQYYLLIDEINRGDIPRIFGELLTLLEKPKRNTALMLPLSGEAFSVPSNLFVVGTMNTADRSIALLDTALRRRFGFIELLPDSSVLGSTVIAGIPLGLWLHSLNRRISGLLGQDGRNLQVGHSYFLSAGRPIVDMHQLTRILQEDILPLLEEYCYDNWDTLEQILGRQLVDVNEKRFRTELLAPDRQDDLVQALLAPDPTIGASAIAIAADASAERDAETEKEDEDDETV
jgi:5-methylcytosine-specific restriction protein B